MDWLLLIVEIASIIAVFLLGLFTKKYLPSYMEKKGENLATKEDVKEITRRTEEVQQEFRQEMARFSKDLEFKYDFYYKQYDGLYSFLYAIVSQSEYTKHIIKLTDGRELTFDEYPFVKNSPTRTVKTTYEIGKTTHQETLTETEISEFDQKKICEYIISNGHLATPELLKLAVSYRLVTNLGVDKEIADNEEFRLIKEIVMRIVKEYNFFRKELQMSYNEEELGNGTITI